MQQSNYIWNSRDIKLLLKINLISLNFSGAFIFKKGVFIYFWPFFDCKKVLIIFAVRLDMMKMMMMMTALIGIAVKMSHLQVTVILVEREAQCNTDSACFWRSKYILSVSTVYKILLWKSFYQPVFLYKSEVYWSE